MLTLRRATAYDKEITFLWVTNPEVRKFSFNQSAILWESHLKWFKSHLDNPHCYYYILELENEPVGSIRFDVDQNDIGIINYLIDPKYHGLGYGNSIFSLGLSKLKSDALNIRVLVGYVLVNNAASIHIFRKNNFIVEIIDAITLRFKKYL